MTDSPEHTAESSPPPEFLPDQPRRGFFTQAAAIVIGGLVGLVPLVTGVLFFLDPLFRKKKADAGEDEGGEFAGFTKVPITMEQLKKADKPIQVPIIASKVDKWNRYPDQPIGSAYLQLADDGVTIRAFNVTCPHLGCAVEYRIPEGEPEPEFFCPCHTSAFQLNGDKKNEIPPRALDSLEVKVAKNKDGEEEVWVKYQEFRATLAEKVPV